MEVNNKIKLQVIGKAILKIALGIIVCLVVLVGLLFIGLRIPAVQTRAVQQISAFLSQKLDHDITVGRVDIRFFSRVLLQDVQVWDHRQEELFYVGSLAANISAFSLFQPNVLHLSSVTLEEPRARLVTYEGTNTLNVNTFLQSLNRLIDKKEDAPPSAFKFDLDALHVQNGRLAYHNLNYPLKAVGLDYNHLLVEKISGSFTGLDFFGDSIQTQISNLQATERISGIRLHELSSRMTFAPTFWEWEDLTLQVNKSRLADYLRFDYRKLGNLAYFIDSVQVSTRLREVELHTQDLAEFAPALRPYLDVLRGSGGVKGYVSHFTAQGLDLRYGKHTRLVGNISADGLPNLKETFADLNLKPSTINAKDLRPFLPDEAYAIAARLGTVELQGQFLGFATDFVANGTFVTDLGRVESDINLKIEQNRNASTYTGFLKTDNFNVGKLIGDESIIRTVTMTGRVEGRGFDLEKARLGLNATINSISLNNYNYRNIVTNATLSRQTFQGQLSINDPNLVFQAFGNVDLRNNNHKFDISGRLDRANLQTLGITDKALSLQSDLRLNFQGNELDEIMGLANFRNAQVSYQGRTLNLDTVEVVSALTGRTRSLSLTSDYLDLEATGEFDFTTLVRDLKTLAQEYRLNFESNEAAIRQYYLTKRVQQIPDYEVNFTAKLKEVNPLVQLFVPLLRISDQANLEGTLRNGNTSIVSVFAEVDTIAYDKAQLFQNSFEFTTSKLPYNNEVLASAIFTSRQQQLPGAGATEGFYVEGVWNERTIDFSTNISQTGTTNRANISGNVEFLADQLQLVFQSSSINILGREWHLAPDNMVHIAGAGKELNFENIRLFHQNQSISLSGALSENPERMMNIVFSNFQLRTLNPLLPQKINGTLNGDLHLQDVYNQMILTSRLVVEAFFLDSLLIGDIHASTDWDNAQQRLQVALDVERDRKRVLNVSGFFYPQEALQQLSLLAVLDDAQIKMVEPFLAGLFQDLSGTAAGRINISGSLGSPILKGSAQVTDGRFTFGYLNTTYNFNDRIHFNENSIAFQNLRLRDMYGNQAVLNGGLFHDGFANMVVDLKASFNRFMLLNTTRAQNELYYGSAIATGSASVLGSPSNLVVQVDARSDRGTFIYIPLDNTTSISRQPFINFVNRNITDTTAVEVAVERERTDLSGINLTFNLDITEDAETSIIFDERAGDIIRGRGNGRIRMLIDTRGEFSMFGNYEIVRGAYNFTLAGLINKEFVIREGGTISWNGDPLGGTMDLAATYTQYTSLQFLAGNSTLTDNDASRVRYPVTAVMQLKGSLMSPEIRLGLEFNQVFTQPEIEAQATAFVARLRNDEQELNRQVFSLLAFRQLSPENEFRISGGAAGSAVSSISDFLTGQFSNRLSQVDSNLEVDIGVGANQMERENALQALQVRVGYSLFGGRLRVSRQGGLSNVSTATNQNSTVVGDWTVEYYLRPDGKLRLKMHYYTTPRRFDINTTASAGVSVLHTERFDSFAELFARKRPRRRDQVREEEQEQIILDSDERIVL